MTASLNADNVKTWTVFAMNTENAVLASVQACNGKLLKARVKAIDAFRSALVFEKLDTGNFEHVIRYF